LALLFIQNRVRALVELPAEFLKAAALIASSQIIAHSTQQGIPFRVQLVQALLLLRCQIQLLLYHWIHESVWSLELHKQLIKPLTLLWIGESTINARGKLLLEVVLQFTHPLHALLFQFGQCLVVAFPIL
jgi:hypothetical protein